MTDVSALFFDFRILISTWIIFTACDWSFAETLK